MAESNGKAEVKFQLPEIKFTKLFINGEFVDSISGKTFETRDPRNGEVLAEVAEGDKEDIDLAVNAAREAFDHGPWPPKGQNIDEICGLSRRELGRVGSN
ncbi:hypothetical protein V2J09_002913 [Rumex salicifolius]